MSRARPAIFKIAIAWMAALAAVMLLLSITPTKAAAAENYSYVEDSIFVKLQETADESAKLEALRSINAESVERVDGMYFPDNDCYADLCLVTLGPDSPSAPEAVETVKRHDGVSGSMLNRFYGQTIGGQKVDYIEGWNRGYGRMSISFHEGTSDEEAQAVIESLSPKSWQKEDYGSWYCLVLSDDMSVAWGIAKALENPSVKSAEPESLMFPDPVPPDQGPATKYDTAALQAREAYPDGCADVILVSGSVWPDGLVASGLAGALDAPILLIEKDSIPDVTSKAITELGCSRAFIIGGEAVVSSETEQAVAALMGCAPIRLAGTHATDTAGEVYDWGANAGLWNSDLVLAATNRSFYDSLSLSALAASQGAPILLCNATGTLCDADWTRVASSQASRIVFAGGTAVVSDDALSKGRQLLGNSVRVAGDSLYQTSFAIARWCVEEGYLAWNNIAFASGGPLSFTDALCGSILQAKRGAVTLIVYESAYGTSEFPALETYAAPSINDYNFFGGYAVISDTLRYNILSTLI